jgi:hypothetical protein
VGSTWGLFLGIRCRQWRGANSGQCWGFEYASSAYSILACKLTM